MVQDGRDIDLTVAPDGTIVEIETQIDPANLPEAVSDAMKAHKIDGKIRWAEITTRGKRRRYEVIVVTTDQTVVEAEFGADRNLLDLDRED